MGALPFHRAYSKLAPACKKGSADVNQPSLPAHPLRLPVDRGRTALPFDLVPDPAALTAIAAHLDLLGCASCAFKGALPPVGRLDWRLDGQLGATVVQPCGLTLAPVTTRIDEAVVRRIWPTCPPRARARSRCRPTTRPKPCPPRSIWQPVMIEALSLALPPFPRAAGAAFAAPVPPEEPPPSPFAVLRKICWRNRLIALWPLAPGAFARMFRASAQGASTGHSWPCIAPRVRQFGESEMPRPRAPVDRGCDMAVPQNKTSKSRRNMRRAHDFLVRRIPTNAPIAAN